MSKSNMRATWFWCTILLLGALVLTYAPQSLRAEPKKRTLVELSDDLDSPIAIIQDPRSPQQLLIAEKTGLVLALNITTGRIRERIDIEELIEDSSPQGIIGITATGSDQGTEIFVAYVDSMGDLTVGRFMLSADTQSLDEDSMTVVLKIARLSAHFLGGSLTLGTDGLLYIGVSDGEGNASQRTHTAQMPQSLLGKIIRIKPRERLGYSVPVDNPFLKHPSYQPEIWALGFRYPTALHLHSDATKLLVLDSDERNHEINLVTGGGNYGWDSPVGGSCVLPDCPKSSVSPPLLTLPKTTPGSYLVGGVLYSLSQYPELKGSIIFAEKGSKVVYSAMEKTSALDKPIVVTKTPNGTITALGQGQTGKIYIGTDTGHIFVIQ